MSLTNTVTSEKHNTSENLQFISKMSDLKSIRWVGDTHYFQQAYQSSLNRYNHYKTWPIIRWIFAAIEITVISSLMFIQQLPWPEKVVHFVYRVDHMIESGLNYSYDKLDWVSVTMKETVVPFVLYWLKRVTGLLEKVKTK